MVALLLSVLSLIILNAAVFQMVESIPLDGNAQWIGFHDAMYMSMVTFTTVGYGDIVAKTTLGRMMMMIAIPVGFIFVTAQTGKLMNLAQRFSDRMTLQSMIRVSRVVQHMLLHTSRKTTTNMQYYVADSHTML